jgi:hypothetical protein
MAGRAVERSAAYAALSDGGRRVLQVIEQEVGHDGVAISLEHFMSRGMCRSAARNGIKRSSGSALSASGWRSVMARRAAHWRALCRNGQRGCRRPGVENRRLRQSGNAAPISCAASISSCTFLQTHGAGLREPRTRIEAGGTRQIKAAWLAVGSTTTATPARMSDAILAPTHRASSAGGDEGLRRWTRVALRQRRWRLHALRAIERRPHGKSAAVSRR